MTSSIQTLVGEYSPYLNDVWRRIYDAAFFFVGMFAIGFFSTGWIIRRLRDVFDISNVQVVVTSPFQFLDLAVDIGMFIAIIATFPLLVWHAYAFLRPALLRSEHRAFLFSVPLSFGLFLLGFAYGFFSLYWGLQMIADLNTSVGLANIWDVGLFLSQLTLTAALMGVLFQFPIVLSALIKFGVIDYQFLISHRRLAVAATVVIVSLLPPTDGLSLLIMSGPLLGLYELTILWNRVGGTLKINH